MIRLIEGEIESTTGNQVVILTSSGIGYLISIPHRILCLPGEHLRLHTHLVVRETALDLYGFVSSDDLLMFELLLTISGIGPKSALQIIDQAPRELLVEAIRLEDASHLTKMSGLSKKTAEKIILGLKDKITHHQFPSPNGEVRTDTSYQDAFDTLITLGYNPQAVREVLESQSVDKSTSELVAIALKQLT